MEKGYVQIYTGDGKGKTTAAIGIAVRAAGHGINTYIGQFMKGMRYGELDGVLNIPQITIDQYADTICCMRREDVTQMHIGQAKTGLARAREAMLSGKYEIVILDEVNVSIWFGLLEEKTVLTFMDQRPSGVELILTGRMASETLMGAADLVTEMKEIKHYYQQGVEARDGIER